MSRNKTAKRINKRQALNNLATLQKIEKDFLTTPVKLAGHLNKEIASLKQKESKLKKEITKNNAQIKNAETRIKLSTKSKTATGKRQLTSAKKVFKKIMKNHFGLNKQYHTLTKSLQQLIEKQTKLLALGKYLKQFDKEWLKNSKKLPKTKPKSKKQLPQSKTTSSIQEQPQTVDIQDNRVDTVKLPETTEELVS